MLRKFENVTFKLRKSPDDVLGRAETGCAFERNCCSFSTRETNYLPISLIGVFLPGIEGTATGAREWTEVRCAAEASIPVWRLR